MKAAKLIAKYAPYPILGITIGELGYGPFDSWEWWALFLLIMLSFDARQWAMSA